MILSEADVAENFAKVNAADRKELEAFARFKTCIAKRTDSLTSTNVIDCVLGPAMEGD